MYELVTKQLMTFDPSKQRFVHFNHFFGAKSKSLDIQKPLWYLWYYWKYGTNIDYYPPYFTLTKIFSQIKNVVSVDKICERCFESNIILFNQEASISTVVLDIFLMSICLATTFYTLQLLAMHIPPLLFNAMQFNIKCR